MTVIQCACRYQDGFSDDCRGRLSDMIALRSREFQQTASSTALDLATCSYWAATMIATQSAAATVAATCFLQLLLCDCMPAYRCTAGMRQLAMCLHRNRAQAAACAARYFRLDSIIRTHCGDEITSAVALKLPT